MFGGASSDSPDWAGLSPFAGDLQHFAGGAHGFDVLGIRFDDDSGHDVAIVGVLIQYFIHGVFDVFAGSDGECDEFFRPTVYLATLEVHDSLAQGLVGGSLFVRNEQWSVH